MAKTISPLVPRTHPSASEWRAIIFARAPVQTNPGRGLADWQRRFKKLEPDTGGYHELDALGYQVLLNYRSSDSVAEQVTLTDILSDSIAELPNLVKDRIVLIGTTAKSLRLFSHPYSAGQWSQEMPGVVIQAHMVSQILSAVLDRRPLLWWLPQWGETLWV